MPSRNSSTGRRSRRIYNAIIKNLAPRIAIRLRRSEVLDTDHPAVEHNVRPDGKGTARRGDKAPPESRFRVDIVTIRSHPVRADRAPRPRTPTLATVTTATQDTERDTTRTSAGGHRFSLTAAADATNTSKRTLLRHADDLTRHGATKDSTGAWSIPVASLLACGFKVGAPRTGDNDQPAPGHAPARTNDSLEALRAELAAVRAELVDAEHRAVLAETQRTAAMTLAAERAAHIDSLRIALRALPPAPEPTSAPDQPAHRHHWWRRR